MTIPSVGDALPSFKVKDQNGNDVSDNSLKGQKTVLFFYPKDNTPTCTKEACNLRDNYKVLQDAGYTVYGISVDGEKSHHKFIDKHDLPFDLLVDENKEMVEAFGVWQKKKMYGREYMGTVRTTFVVNEEGKIDKVIEKVKADRHHEQILEKD